MQGKIALVTGANSGIGKETALALAAQGAHVILVARNADKGERAKGEIVKRTGNARVDFLLADMSSQESIRALANQVLQDYPRLDVLVNNAGGLFPERTVTVDGYERTFATNHLGYFLLTRLLLDRLVASAPARIVNVASEAHKSGDLNLDDLQNAGEYTAFEVYGQSKMANIVFTYELARRLEGTGVTANCLHPGVVRTGFGGASHGLFKFGLRLLQPFMLSAAKGAQTTIHLAASPDVEGVTGKYFIKKRPARSRRRSHDEALGLRLWNVSEELTGLAPAQGATRR